MTNLLPRLEFLLQSCVRRRDKCPNCGDRETELLGRKHVVTRIRRCPTCELCFTDPIYDKSLLGPLYDRVYGAEGSTTSTPSAERLVELIQSGFAGTDKDCRDRLRTLRRIAPGPRLLEVGSSWGYFLHQAQAAGFQPTGIEISGPRREFGRELLRVDTRDSFEAVEGESFDVIYTAHTLEHFTSFSGVLVLLRRLLGPGGLLAIEVPNFAPHLHGREAMTQVGAVHPLGFRSAFFRKALPAAGLRVRSFHERWGDVPHKGVDECRGDVVIVLAERAASEDAEECAA
ncbi:MAG: methyltransferase domain-containing protein [Planctomycetota bacterium]